MANFDRFDICEAHWLLESDYNIGGIISERKSNIRRNESTGCQLARMQFTPSMSLDFDSLSDNGKEIYLANVLRLKLPMDEELMIAMEEFWIPEYLVAMRSDSWEFDAANGKAVRI